MVMAMVEMEVWSDIGDDDVAMMVVLGLVMLMALSDGDDGGG